MPLPLELMEAEVIMNNDVRSSGRTGHCRKMSKIF